MFTLAAEIGFSRPFLVTAAPVPIDREDFKKILGRIFFIFFNVIFLRVVVCNGHALTQCTV